MQITVQSDTPEEFDAMMNSIAAATSGPSLKQVLQEIQTMSTTLEQQIQAATTELAGDIAEVATDLKVWAASVTPGSTLTQADVDALNAVVASADAAKAAADALANPTPPAPAPGP